MSSKTTKITKARYARTFELVYGWRECRDQDHESLARVRRKNERLAALDADLVNASEWAGFDMRRLPRNFLYFTAVERVAEEYGWPEGWRKTLQVKPRSSAWVPSQKQYFGKFYAQWVEAVERLGGYPDPEWFGPPTKRDEIVVCDPEKRDLSPRLRFAILTRDKFRCRYCGAGSGVTELQVDHIIPFSAGGATAPGNLITACRQCNNGKRDTFLPDDLFAEIVRSTR